MPSKAASSCRERSMTRSKSTTKSASIGLSLAWKASIAFSPHPMRIVSSATSRLSERASIRAFYRVRRRLKTARALSKSRAAAGEHRQVGVKGDAQHEDDSIVRRRPSASAPARSSVMTPQIGLHLVSEPLRLDYGEPLKAQASKNVSSSIEIGLCHRILPPRNAMSRPTFLIEKREPDLTRIERLEGFDFEPSPRRLIDPLQRM